jgi:DNA-binding response OmpR family regulator
LLKLTGCLLTGSTLGVEMVILTKIKVLAFGSELMQRQLANQVNPDEVTIEGCNDAAEAVAILEKEQFDLIVIDDRVSDLERICRGFYNLAHAPVALMLRKQDADWKKLGYLTVDGYLPDEASKMELSARIKACARRKPVNAGV